MIRVHIVVRSNVPTEITYDLEAQLNSLDGRFKQLIFLRDYKDRSGITYETYLAIFEED